MLLPPPFITDNDDEILWLRFLQPHNLLGHTWLVPDQDSTCESFSKTGRVPNESGFPQPQ